MDATSLLCTRLGNFLSEMELFEAAAALQARALEIDHTLFNNMSRRVAESTVRLAATQHAMGRSQESIQNLYLAFGIYKQLSKPEFEDENACLDAAKTLVLIAKVSRAAGQSSQAKSMMAYALRTIRSTLGDNHPDVAAVLNSISSLCLEVGSGLGPKQQKVMLAEAQAYAEEALAIAEECVTEADLSSAEARRTLGRIALTNGNIHEALKHFTRAADLLHRVYGADALPLAEVLEDTAVCHLRVHHATHGFRGSQLAGVSSGANSPPAAPSGQSSPSVVGSASPDPTGASGSDDKLPAIGANPSAVGGNDAADGEGSRVRVSGPEVGGKERVAVAEDDGDDDDDDDADESAEEQVRLLPPTYAHPSLDLSDLLQPSPTISNRL